MKVALVFPRTKYVSGDPPLGLCYIASYLRCKINDIDIIIIDSTFHNSLNYIKKQLKIFKPDIAGIYADTSMHNNAVCVAEFAKDMGVFTITGGPHATVCPQSLEGKSDVVVKGEGEETLLEIIKNKDTVPVFQRHIQNLDDIPFPALDLLNMNSYVSAWNYLDSVSIGLKGTTMITSRGCPYKCSFCQPTLDLLFGPALRRRSPENVVDEIIYLLNNYPIKGIFFHDDVFTTDKNWVFKFCTLIKGNNIPVLWGCNSRIDTVDEDMLNQMYKSGLRKIHFGIESATQRILNDVYNKKINIKDMENAVRLAKKIGIHMLGFFMIGAPGEGAEEINATIGMANKLPLDEATFSITTPFEGTYLYEKIKNAPGYEISKDYGDFDYYRKISIKQGGISKIKLRSLQIKALFMFYMQPARIKYILRHLLNLAGIKQLYIKLKRFI